MAFITSRRQVVRGLPPGLAGEDCGEKLLALVANVLLEALVQLVELGEELIIVLRHSGKLFQRRPQILVPFKSISSEAFGLRVLTEQGQKMLLLDLDIAGKLIAKLREQALTGAPST
jgi:hypothetical protein